MIIKPSITWLTTDSDALLINDVGVVLAGLANNPTIYTTPAPALPEVQTALDNFVAGVTAAADGGRSAISARNNLRLILVGLMRQLASYVQVACKGDMTNLLLSGFPVQKPVRQPVGVLPAPANVTIKLGERSGMLLAKASPVFGASIYNWRLTNASTGAVIQTGQTPSARTVFDGLTPGVTYTATVNTVGAAGPSDWSNPVSQMAI
ncbi:MAG TPA: fibronectin type III domain-containing protein [bacterium]|nr:fibronectin type III domain-containing protein [bacterium]